MDILTKSAQSYINTFGGFVNQFITWGQWILASLLSINFGWLCLWYAIDKESISKTMPSFLRQFFIILLFYTLMINPDWLLSILKTVEFMGQSVTGIPIDPSSLISNGIMIGNKITVAISKTSLLTAGFSLLVIVIVYIAVVAIFIYIALDLAQTLIVTTALISISALFLGFAALGATTQIARNTLDVILGNCVKLLGIYIVVGAGAKTITAIAATIPTTINSLDPYWWLLAATLLFLGLVRVLPVQLARIVSGAVHESHGADTAAVALAATQYAKTAVSAAVPVAGMVAGGAAGLAKIAGSTAYNAASHFAGSVGTGGLGMAALKTAGGTAKDSIKAGFGTVADHFKNISNKLAGGPGIADGNNAGTNSSESKIPGYASRMYMASKDVQTSSKISGEGNSFSEPNSQGQKNNGETKPVSKPSNVRSSRSNSDKSKK